MTITVFSGLMAQGVAGRLSDRFDRTIVLTGIVVAIAIISGFIFIHGAVSFGGMILGIAVSGALIFTVYPISVARAHDLFGESDTMAVSAGLLFAVTIQRKIKKIEEKA
jgi:MFS family permease